MKAVVADGEIRALEPLPVDWSEGQLLRVEKADDSDDVARRFHALVRSWKSETTFLSSISDIVAHPAYQEIIALGPAVVPLILDEMRREADQWFWALQTLTGENPAPLAAQGNMKEMTAHWLKWAEKHGL